MSSNTTSKSLTLQLSRLGSVPATAEPIVRAEINGNMGHKVYAAEWGLDSNQDISRAGIFTRGLFQGGYWLLVGDGHGPSSSIPRFLRECQDIDLENCMSSNSPGEEIELLIAKKFPHGVAKSGICLVLARVTILGEIEIWNAGDARAVVLANEEGSEDVTTLLQTEDHTAFNASELQRHLKKECYKEAALGIPSNPSLEELQLAGVEGGLLAMDPNMLSMLPPIQGSNAPRATFAPGYRFKYSSDEKWFQMSRSVGHQPLGVSGINWDYYKTVAPSNSKIHLILSSDGLWDIAPSTKMLFDWCELGGANLITQIVERWCGNWDYEHPWDHQCTACRKRRISYLLLLYARKDMTVECNVEQVVKCLVQDLQLAIKDNNLNEDEKKTMSEHLDRFSKINVVSVFQPRRPVLPPLKYDPIITTQQGIKPDDVCVAMCSWKTRSLSTEPPFEDMHENETSLTKCIGVTAKLQKSLTE